MSVQTGTAVIIGAATKEETRTESQESAINLSDETGGAAAAVNISENLPPLYKEIWYDADNMEYEHFHDREELQLPPAAFEDEKGQNPNKRQDKDRWSILMNKLTNIENNTSSLSRDLNALADKVGANSEQVSATNAAVSKNEQEIATINRRYDAVWAEVDQKMQEKFCAMEAAWKQANEEANEAFRVRVLREAEHKAEDKAQEVTKELQREFIQEKYDSRKINLLIMGIPESEKDETKDLVNSFLSKRMAISDFKVDIAYRLGKLGNHKSRPILVRFKEMAHRNRVWFSKSKINQKGPKAWIQEDLPKAVKNSYRTFFRILRKAKSMGDRFPDAHIKGQSLFIDGKAYGEGDLEQLPDILRPSSLAMMQSERAVIFFGRFSPLSNHYQAPFMINGSSFSCMEQYIAWKRATHTGNDKMASKALKQADPIFYKGILNDLKANTSNDANKARTADQWYNQLDEVVGQGLRAKFQQNPTLAHFLCKTHPKALGEACLDTRWGIGFTLTDPNALDTEKWPTEGNVMGRQLSAIRDELLANKNA